MAGLEDFLDFLSSLIPERFLGKMGCLFFILLQIPAFFCFISGNNFLIFVGIVIELLAIYLAITNFQN